MSSHSVRAAGLATVFFTALLVVGLTSRAEGPQTHAGESSMRQRYDAAYRLQSSGDISGADREHTAFLVGALGKMANGYANIGDYAHAAPIYEEAIALSPADFTLLRDYAGAAIDAEDPAKAQSLLETALEHIPAGASDAQRGEAHRMLGDALLALNRNDPAIEQYRSAAALDAGFDDLYALANALLESDGDGTAAPVFARITALFGDTAAVRMQIGRAYALARLYPKAIEEFRKAIEKDPGLAGVHYSLGAAYMSNSEKDLSLAQAEFRKELALHPKDSLAYPQLAHIALTHQDFHEAELDLRRATIASPRNPDNFMELGKIYLHGERLREAEAAFRQAIAVTQDPARKRYAIQSAHYELGRLLVAAGNKTEGEQELKISDEMLDRRRQQDEGIMSGKTVVSARVEKLNNVGPGELEAVKSAHREFAPLIAGSYNNLGVHAAIAGDYAKASTDFQHAAEWNPALPGVESNWGRAAFAAHRCTEAVEPLQRAVAANPADIELHTMLDECRQSLSAPGQP